MATMSRRHFLGWTGAGAAALVLAADSVLGAAEEGSITRYPFKLPKLPYAFDALEPHIDARTMEIHHDKHHAAYVANLNAALKDRSELQKKSLLELIRGIATLPPGVGKAVRNNGGGHLNHTLFWRWMAKKGGGEPKGDLGKAIDKAFGSFAKFQAEFSKAAATRFGSGWAWLISNKGTLKVVSTANQDNPVSAGAIPLLGLDVWEHAYYLKYQNVRPAYVKAWWNVVNWDDVAERHSKLKSR